jgi:hypothetical protein
MSATIYAFPARGRHVTGGQRDQMKLPLANVASPQAVKTVIGNSWYHEEAIEADRAPKN